MELTSYSGSPYGKTLRAIEAAGLRLAELVYHPNSWTPKHSHDGHRIVIRLQGNSIQTDANKSVTRTAWSVGFCSPGDVHADHFLPPGVRNLKVEFSPGYNFWNLRDCLRTLNRSFVVNDGALHCLCARLYSEFRQPDELSALAIEGLAMELVAGVMRADVHVSARKPPLWLKQAEEVIRSRYAERLALAEIAGAVGIHPVHLAREFRRLHGCSIGEYARQLRINYAIEQISKTNRSLVDIALAAGFSDQSNFSKTFRRLTGLAPLRFRKTVSSR